MGFEWFNKAKDTVKQSAEDALKAREQRLNSPQFKHEMNKEKAKLTGELQTMGDNTWNATTTVVVEGVFRPFQIAGKLVGDKNYKVGNALAEGGTAIARIGRDVIKLGASMGVVSGRLLKIGARRSVAK
jgi:hypothetical protein